MRGVRYIHTFWFFWASSIAARSEKAGSVQMSGKGFAQRLRHVIAKYESSLASAGDGILFGRSFRQDAVDRPLPAVLKPTLDPDFPTPLIKESRSFFGTHVTYDNPWAPGATTKSFREIFKLLQTSKYIGKSPSAQEQKRDLPHAEVELEAIANHKGDDPMRVTWVGHSTLLVQVDGLNILTDPIFSQRASPIQMMGPKRYSPPAMEVSELPPIDLVLISHNHYDHLDSGSVSAIGNSPIWLVPKGLKRLMASLGVNRCVELSWWEEVEVEGSRGAVRVASTPAQHWSQRGLFDRNTSLWCGYAVTGHSERFFFAGDAAYAPIYNQIGQRYGPFDLAAIPIGAYEPAWFVKDNHCGPDEAVIIHKELGAKRSLSVHWGTFPLAADLHVDAPRELVKSCRARGLKSSEFSVLRHGESLVNDDSPRRYKCLFGSDDL